MSRDYIDNPPEDAAFSLRSIDEALTRIADTLDDYMEMSLGLQAVTRQVVGDPEAALKGFTEVLDRIQKNRERRAR